MADSTQTNQSGVTGQQAGQNPPVSGQPIPVQAVTAASSSSQAASVKSSQPSAKGGDITVDKNKSAEQYLEEAERKYIVPKLVREKFSDLIKLIFETESMNTEEREYWLQIMPIMTEEQINKFRDILVNERDQLAKLDREYGSEMGGGAVKEIDEKKMKEKLQEIRQKEILDQEADKKGEEDLLKKLNEV